MSISKGPFGDWQCSKEPSHHDATELVTTRSLPTPSDNGGTFWRSGADGTLRVQRCVGCGNFMHPPDAACTTCGGTALTFEAVSGRATLHAFTTYCNVEEGKPKPVIGVVELVEQAGLFLACDLSNVPFETLHVGILMRVEFEEPSEGLYVPQFVPELRDVT
jgi:uncharacterized protein